MSQLHPARPQPLYKENDNVSFLLDGEQYIGTIFIVDKFGIFFDNSEPYYDIWIEVQGKKILVKHIPQSRIEGLINV